jgi:hypothetical protein
MKKARILVAVLLVSFCGFITSALPASASNSLVVVQDAPVLASHPDPDIKPNTTGAVLFFGADLRDTKGKKVGELIGQVTTLDVTLDGVDEVDNFRELVFNMKKGQIVVLGASQYVAGNVPNFASNNAPVTAVIVGGTGKYVGVRGVVTTKKRANGTFRHTFTFVH